MKGYLIGAVTAAVNSEGYDRKLMLLLVGRIQAELKLKGYYNEWT